MPKSWPANYVATSLRAGFIPLSTGPGLPTQILVITNMTAGADGERRIIVLMQEAKMKNGAALILLIGVAAACGRQSEWAGSGEDADDRAVRQLMMNMYDKPEAPLGVEAVVVEQDVAIADWSQGELGGRALLRRKDGAWQYCNMRGRRAQIERQSRKAGHSEAGRRRARRQVVRSGRRYLPGFPREIFPVRRRGRGRRGRRTFPSRSAPSSSSLNAVRSDRAPRRSLRIVERSHAGGRASPSVSGRLCPRRNNRQKSIMERSASIESTLRANIWSFTN